MLNLGDTFLDSPFSWPESLKFKPFLFFLSDCLLLNFEQNLFALGTPLILVPFLSALIYLEPRKTNNDLEKNNELTKFC